MLASGLSERKIDYGLERGGLWPLFTSVYSVGSPAKSWRAIWLGATLAAGADSMLAGKSAAALWGLTLERPMRIEVNRPGGRNRIERAAARSGWNNELCIRVRSSHPPQPAIVHGIPVMPVPDLLLELAPTTTPAEMEALVSAASQKKFLNATNVAGLLEKGRGRPGIDRMRFQLRYWDPEMRNVLSVLETKLMKACARNESKPRSRTGSSVA